MNTQKDAQAVPQDQDGGQGSPPALFTSFLDFMAFFASLVIRGCAG
jgi:hypothetical protein